MSLHDEISKFLQDDKGTLPSGWDFIDRCLRRSGIKKGFLISVIGSKKIGKTYFATNWIYRLIKDRMKVYFFSAEMSRIDIGIRLIQLYAEKSERSISGDIEKGDGRMYENISRYIEYYCQIDETTSPHIDYICETIRKNSLYYDYFFIDHHMKVETDSTDIYKRVTQIFKRLFEVTHKSNARVGVFVQSNQRGSTNFADGSVLPSMGSGLGSSEIERNSDMVVVMANPGMDDKCDPSRKNGILARVFQGRHNDDSGIVWLPYDPQTSIIKEIIF